MTRPRRTDGGRSCTLCGSTEHLEGHHVGGRQHARWFTLPLCRVHHVEITKALSSAGVEMRHTANRIVRVGRAMQALAVFLWRLADVLLAPEGPTNEH
jgi:hypothetical protein